MAPREDTKVAAAATETEESGVYVRGYTIGRQSREWKEEEE
jgi:hypothetical protein